MRFVTVFVGALLIAPAHGATSFISTGNDLLFACENDGDRTYCLGYIAGVMDVFEQSRELQQKRQCLPLGAHIGQVRDVVLKYLQRNPTRRTNPVASLVETAVVETWHCG